jgi:hypothetical protein
MRARLIAWRIRLQTLDGHTLYSKRKITVETTFGIMKSAMGFRSFVLRGIKKVEGELTLVCTAYNFKRLSVIHHQNFGER